MPLVAPPDLLPALPEILLACAAMALLLLGVFRGDGATRLVSWLAVAVLLATLAVAGFVDGERQVAFYGMFVTDAFALFMKALVLMGSAVCDHPGACATTRSIGSRGSSSRSSSCSPPPA